MKAHCVLCEVRTEYFIQHSHVGLCNGSMLCFFFVRYVLNLLYSIHLYNRSTLRSVWIPKQMCVYTHTHAHIYIHSDECFSLHRWLAALLLAHTPPRIHPRPVPFSILPPGSFMLFLRGFSCSNPGALLLHPCPPSPAGSHVIIQLYCDLVISLKRGSTPRLTV